MLLKLLIVYLAVLKYGTKANDASNLCLPPSCDLYCSYGHVLDDKGCKTCSCVEPCAGKECPTGQVCKPQLLLCKKPPCGYEAHCVPECPLYKCAANCDYGYEVDNNGCRTCTCIDHCKNHVCENGKVCVAEPLCPFGTCGIRTKCIKECPALPCHLTAKCTYGFELDCDNCQTCTCKNPCGGVVCPNNEYCHVQVIYCLVAPCPPPHATCNAYCPDSSPLLGLNDLPVRCDDSSGVTCPLGYTCKKDVILRSSFCCAA